MIQTKITVPRGKSELLAELALGRIPKIPKNCLREGKFNEATPFVWPLGSVPRLCPVLCPPPNPTKCYPASGHRWKPLLGMLSEHFVTTRSIASQVVDSSSAQNSKSAGLRPLGVRLPLPAPVQPTPLGELRKTNTVAFPHAEQHSVEQVAGERTDSQSDQTSVADEYERRQRDEIIRALTACKGRVGGVDGAAASLGMNRTTFLSRMKKFGIYAKQYA